MHTVDGRAPNTVGKPIARQANRGKPAESVESRNVDFAID